MKLHQAPGKQRRRLYQTRLAIPSHGILTNLPRILFDVGKSQRLRERPEGNFRDIAPTSYTLRTGYDRTDVLAAINPELAGLVSKAFAIADQWHGLEIKKHQLAE